MSTRIKRRKNLSILDARLVSAAVPCKPPKKSDPYPSRVGETNVITGIFTRTSGVAAQLEVDFTPYFANTSWMVVATLKLTPSALKCALPHSTLRFSVSRRLSLSCVLLVSLTKYNFSSCPATTAQSGL